MSDIINCVNKTREGLVRTGALEKKALMDKINPTLEGLVLIPKEEYEYYQKVMDIVSDLPIDIDELVESVGG